MGGPEVDANGSDKVRSHVPFRIKSVQQLAVIIMVDFCELGFTIMQAKYNL